MIGGLDYKFENISADHTIAIACDCTPPKYPITSSSSGPGCTITPNGVTQYVHGSSASYSYGSSTANCYVDSLTVDGVSQKCDEVVAFFDKGSFASGGTGSISKYTMEYRKLAKTARIYAKVSAENTGITLAVNDGPNPKSFGGDMALFYFDCTNAFNPRVTVYTYNGENAATSYLRYKTGATTPDFIISSVGNVGPGKTFSDIQCGITADG